MSNQVQAYAALRAVTTSVAAAVIGSVALATGASASTTGQPNPNPCPTQTVQPVTTGYGVQPMCPTPAPTPTVTPTQPVIPTPTPTPRPRLRPESFRLVINNNFSSVSAFGPVRGFGTDVTVTPILDHFLLPNNANRVNVFHAPLPFPRTAPARGRFIFVPARSLGLRRRDWPQLRGYRSRQLQPGRVGALPASAERRLLAPSARSCTAPVTGQLFQVRLVLFSPRRTAWVSLAPDHDLT